MPFLEPVISGLVWASVYSGICSTAATADSGLEIDVIAIKIISLNIVVPFLPVNLHTEW